MALFPTIGADLLLLHCPGVHSERGGHSREPGKREYMQANTSNPQGHAYLFEFSAKEGRRLQTQAQLIAPSTQRLFERAGITTGMKVLEVGSGAGDVALLAGGMVGPTGTVVGVERNTTSLEHARARVRAAGLTNVAFVEADLTTLQLEEDFDAVVGRLVLQHLPDPVAALRGLVRHLRPGGIVAFQEIAVPEAGASMPSVPLFEQMYQWAREGLRRGGVESRFGFHLYQIFLDAGLPAPELHCDSFVGAGPEWGWYDVIAETVRTLLPAIVAHGIATDEEIAIDTLAQRCREAVVSQRGVVRAPDYISAWTRIGASHSGRADV